MGGIAELKLLAGRSIPNGWRPLPRFLLQWCQTSWGNKHRISMTQEMDLSVYHQLVASDKRSRDKKLRAATQIELKPGHPDSPLPALLSIRALRVYSEILSIGRAQGVLPNEYIFFKPIELVRGLDLANSGTAYENLEAALVELATFGFTHGGESCSHLVTELRTTRYSVSNGEVIDRSNEDTPICWRVQLPDVLNYLLKVPDATTTYPAAAFKEAGRSPVTQWLVMFYFSHGYDDGTIFDHKLATLASKCNLPHYILSQKLKHLKSYARGDALDQQAQRKFAFKSAVKNASRRMKSAVERVSQLRLFRQLRLRDNALGPQYMKALVRRYHDQAERFLARFNTQIRHQIQTGEHRLSALFQLLFGKGNLSPYNPPPGWLLQATH